MSAHDVPDGARRVRVSVVLLVMACLGIGGLAGYRLRGEPARAPSYLAQLTASLDLRPDQVARLESVLAEEDHEIDALLGRQLQELQEPVAARRERTEQALVALLDATQRARYEQLLSADGAPGAGGERGR